MDASVRAGLAGGLTLAAAMGVGRFVYTPILPHMIGAGALDAPSAGLVASANFLGYLVGALACSLAVFAPVRRGAFALGLAASLVTTLAMGFVTGLPAMAALRFASGVASAFAMIFATAIVMATRARDGRAGAGPLHFAGVGVGIAGSAALVSAMALSGASWPALWWGAAAAALALIAGALALMPADPAPPVAGSPPPARIKAPLVWLIVSYGLFGFGYVITATFINALAKADPRLAGVEPVVWIVVGLAGVPSVFLWGRVAARIGLLPAYAAACLVEAVGVALTVLVAHPATILLGGVLLGGTFMAITALGLARARPMAGPQQVIALMTAAFGVGQIAGPPLAGWLHARTGSFEAASLLAALALVVAAALTLAVTAAERRALAPRPA